MNSTSSDSPETAGKYEIRLRGHLQPRWGVWFEGMTVVSREDGTTTVTGELVDQAALQGLLRRIHDLGIELISVASITT